ncbi:MAG: VCBS domain-containing protein [Allosphingosinicella sp.]
MSWDEIIKGTNGNDVINGGSGDDFLQGRAGGDLLDGGDGDDQLHGDSGDDFVRGGAGNDLLHGGLGTDTAVFSGSILEYSFSSSGGDYFVNHSGGSMIDGYDRLISIERLVFADGVIDLTQNNAPIAHDDTASTDEDVGIYSSGSASVLDNDFDWENNNLTAVAGSFNGAYGTLVLNSDGTYTYTPYASTQALALGEDVQESFNYVVTDGSLSDTGTLTITISGRNDVPAANNDVASTGENMAVSIDVLANDSDVDNGAVLTVTAASAPAGQGSVSVVGNQVQFDPGSDFDYLAVGESAEVVLGYTISDEHGATSNASVTVTVTGTNDAPTIDAGGTTATGSVAELPNDDPGENLVVHETDGVVAFDDLDLSDTHGATATAQGAGYLGTFTLDPVDQGGDTVAWHFDVSDADLDGLEEGEIVTQTYTVTIDDGNGGTATQDVTITLTGASDAAGPPWYIDNSAVGSTNVGSEANPFTSIAAFNAAQGSPGGPAAGDQIFLLAGTGTYAEPDGIDLLDGQILTGIGDPTIAPTAGDGVNVGLGNSISGLNIASGGGDGIAGGDVGALAVSDVDIITTGGVGVEIGSGSGVSITGTTIASGANYAILASNVAGFSLTDSVVSSGAASAGTASFTNLTGTADFLGNILNGGGGDTLSVVNTGGSLSLTIADSESNAAVVGGNDLATGDDGVSITTDGDSSLTLVVDGVDFEGARDDLLEVNANGSSSQDLTITDNNFHNMQASAGGGGVELGGGGAGSNIAVDYQVEGNSFTGASGTAFSAAYTQQAGTVRGYIADNVIGIGDGAAGSEGSTGGDGISATLQKTAGAGDATYLVTIVGNEIHDVDGGSGIAVRASGGGAADAAVMEATIEDNVVDELGDFALAGLYALVGGASGSGDFAELGLALDGNTFDAGDAGFGFDAIFLDQVSSDAHFYVPGYAGSGDGEFSPEAGTASADLTAFWGSNNVLVPTPFNLFGGVDASIVRDLTGEPLTQPVYFP